MVIIHLKEELNGTMNSVKLCKGKENGSRKTYDEVQNVEPPEKVRLIVNSNEERDGFTEKSGPAEENSQNHKPRISKLRTTLDLDRIAKNIMEIKRKLGIE